MYDEEFGWGGVTDLAKNIGKSSQYVSQRIQLLNLPNDMFKKLDEGVVTPSLLREVMVLDDEIRDTIIKVAVDKRLSSRRVGRLAKRLKRDDIVPEQFPDVALVQSDDDKKQKVIARLMCRCIDALRFSLLEFDDAINGVNDELMIRDLLMAQRGITHEQIDFLLRSRKRMNGLVFEKKEDYQGLKEFIDK